MTDSIDTTLLGPVAFAHDVLSYADALIARADSFLLFLRV